MKKNVVVLGSTGSIGTQTLDVIDRHPDLFELYAITANNQVDLLIAQARKYKPSFVIITNEAHYNTLQEALKDEPIKVFCGMESVCDVVCMPSVNVVLTAMVGYAGLRPTIAAIRAGKQIALANKETLVVAGDLIVSLVQQYHTAILPVDSEHSAIFQCLQGEGNNVVEKIWLTASGGPFRGKKRDDLLTVTKADALKHPNWSMGAKITIDSASMMNKGFEVIEAKWLFGVDTDRIEVVVHPQSIVHSMVQFADGSVKAQLGMPDMRVPIQYALTYPSRMYANFPRANFFDLSTLTFEKPDPSTFRNLALAFEAARKGGNAACVLNAANEVAVQAFLNDRIGFLAMSDLLEWAMAKAPFVAHPSYEDYVATDAEVRALCFDKLK